MREKQAGLDLTQGSVLKNLLILSLPIMLANFMQNMYDITDTFWLGKLGAEAKNAVSVAAISFPIVSFFSAFGLGLSVAGIALVSQYRGAKMYYKIQEITGQFMLIFIIFAIFFTLLSFSILNPLLRLLQTPPEIFEVASQYMQITVLGIIFMFTFLAYQALNHGLGDSITPMIIQLFTLLLNALLDPLFIFGWKRFPAYGTLGAAYATLLCRFLTVVLSFYFFKKRTPQYFPRKIDFIPNWDNIKQILKISIPASIAHSSLSFGFIILQGFVNSFGTAVISINSIGSRLLNFFTMPSMGLSSGLAAIVGQNLGANNLPRVKKSIYYSVGVVLLIMITGGLVMFNYGTELTKIFITDPEVVEIGNRMFKLTATGAIFFAILAVLTGVFNGSGHTAPTMILNITRFWLLRVPFVFIMSGKILEFPFIKEGWLNDILQKLAIPLSATPYDAIWWSMLFSNVLTLTLAIFILKRGKWKTKEI